MENKKEKDSKDSSSDKSKTKDIYPGIDINKADDDKVSPELVKERTKELNNNPRNNGKII